MVAKWRGSPSLGKSTLDRLQRGPCELTSASTSITATLSEASSLATLSVFSNPVHLPSSKTSAPSTLLPSLRQQSACWSLPSVASRLALL